MPLARLQLIGPLLLFLAGCGDGVNAVQSAPFDQVSSAKAGDMASLREHARCSGLLFGCPSRNVEYDQKAACEDQVLILASMSPAVSLADADAYGSDCEALLTGANQQEAFAASEQLVHSAYGRDVVLPLEGVKESFDHETLAPSTNDLRVGINAELAKHALQYVPSLANVGPARGVYIGQTQWRACSNKVCFNAVTPQYGGGVSAYRVIVLGHDAPADRTLAAELATAALGQKALAARVEALGSGSLGRAAYLRAGTACWGMGEDDKGNALAGALSPPCKS